jgi:hypothetical protein
MESTFNISISGNLLYIHKSAKLENEDVLIYTHPTCSLQNMHFSSGKKLAEARCHDKSFETIRGKV